MDQFYKEGSSMKCSFSLCCRADHGEPTNADDRAGYWGSVTNLCDIPKRTIVQLAQFLQREIKPDMVLWTGDNPPHDVWDQSPIYQTNATEEIAKILHDNINTKQTRIYPSPGNHDSYPSDIYDYYTNESQWVNDVYANVTSKLFGHESVYDQIRSNGAYSIFDQAAGVRVISLNTQYGDVLNFYLLGDPTDPKNFLQWLRSELGSAELKREKVLIIGHIPPYSCFISSSLTPPESSVHLLTSSN
jgi:sphingomyelin phosphodiesterase